MVCTARARAAAGRVRGQSRRCNRLRRKALCDDTVLQPTDTLRRASVLSGTRVASASVDVSGVIAAELVEDVVALSPTQEGILLQYLRDPGGDAYFVQTAITFRGHVDPAKLRAACQVLVDRHQALRTVLRWEGLRRPVQVILRAAAVDLRVEGGSLGDVRARDRKEKLDITRSSFRLTLVTAGPETHLLISYHHVILDGWSMGVIARELIHAYRGGGPLPTPATVSSVIAAGQARDPQAAAEFWQRYLGDAPGTRLPSLGRARAGAPARHEEVGAPLPAGLVAKVRDCAMAEGVTPAAVYQAAVAIVLGGYGRSDDVVFGTAQSGRELPVAGIESYVGLCIRTLPLRVEVQRGASGGAWCRYVHQRAMARKAFEDTPLVDIARATGTGREPFETILVIENYPLELPREGAALAVRDIVSYEATNYPLTLTVILHGTPRLTCAFDAARIAEGEVGRLTQRWLNTIDALVSAPERAVGEIDLHLPGERPLILGELAGAATVAGADTDTVVERFGWSARTHRARVAVVDGRRTCSYGELDTRTARLAGLLIARGLRPEDRVGILIERSEAFVVAMLAVLRAGGAYVPISPRTPAPRVAEIVSSARPRLLLTRGDLGLAALLGVDTIDVEEAIASGEAVPMPSVSPAQLAYLMYTSGSTGQPKGVMVEHRAVTNTVRWFGTTYGVDDDTRILMLSEPTADPSVEDVLGALLNGGTLHIAPREMLFDRARFRAYVDEHAISLVNFIPSALGELLDGDRLASLRTVIAGSEVLPDGLKDRLVGLGYQLSNNYGPTEATVDALSQRCGSGPVTLGRPIAGMRCLILDVDGGLTPLGMPGELVLLGRGLARGYWAAEALTGEKFVDCPYFPGERMYRTGDLATWTDSGEVRFLGRVDLQVKLQGFRVELGEIEAALRDHPSVRDVAVVARSLRGTTFVAAFVVLGELAPVARQNLLRKGLREVVLGRLPEYMLPHRFVEVERLPRRLNGKVDQARLDQLGFEEDATTFVAPSSAVQRGIAEAWCEALGRETVSVRTPFRDLGGDSVMVIRIYSRLCKLFPGQVTVQDLFDHSTVESLASVIESRLAPSAPIRAHEVIEL